MRGMSRRLLPSLSLCLLALGVAVSATQPSAPRQLRIIAFGAHPDDAELKATLLHNAKEELEHAAMVLEWIRRNDAETDAQLREYLFKDGSITGHEETAMGRE